MAPEGLAGQGRHPDLSAVSFELRRLRIFSLLIEAFWLKASPPDDRIGPNDRFYAFAAFEEELHFKLLPASAFLAIVRGMAKRQPDENSPAAR